ncbi:MAG: hypothetical protein [Cressdnaviricota sp.]|nr:MAG: hypothetical protein [Cressdnaviricota sp.]
MVINVETRRAPAAIGFVRASTPSAAVTATSPAIIPASSRKGTASATASPASSTVGSTSPTAISMSAGTSSIVSQVLFITLPNRFLNPSMLNVYAFNFRTTD